MKFGRHKTAKGYFHTMITVTATFLVVAAIALAIWFFVFYGSYEETNDAQVEQYITPVMARVTGYVQEVNYEENQFVHKGDTLIVIDNREYKAYLDLALADELNARAAVAITDNGAVVTGSKKAVENSRLAGAKAVLLKATQELERYTALFNEEATTKQQLERVKADYDAAQSYYSEVAQSIQSVQLATQEAYSRVPSAKAQVQAKKALSDKAALYLSYTVVTAPYDGWVGKKIIQPGQMVKEGQTLVSVVSKEKWIIANFKETQLKYLKEGQEVELITDAYRSKEFTGYIESLSPASGARFSLLPPDNATGNFVKIEQRIPVKIKFKDAEDDIMLLRAGMNVVVVAEHQN